MPKPKLSWVFTPVEGYPFSIIHAMNGDVHYGHINMYVYGSDASIAGWDEDSVDFFATVKSEEDNEQVGGKAGSKTIQDAMNDLEYRYETGEWHEDHWGGC